MDSEPTLNEIRAKWHGTFKSYLLGLILSIILTAAAYFIVVKNLLEGPLLIFSLMVLGVLQALAQLLFFLHIGQESKPQWNKFVFYLMVLFLVVLVVGSLWIMHDLNQRVMSGM